MRSVPDLQREIQTAVIAAERANEEFRLPDALWHDIQEMQHRFDLYRKQVAPVLVKFAEFMARPEVQQALTTYLEATRQHPEIQAPKTVRRIPASKARVLRAEIASKDARIAQLEAELQGLKLNAAFTAEPYPPMEPDFFSEN